MYTKSDLHTAPVAWSSLQFAYQPCDASYVARFRNGAWEPGELTSDHTLTLSECAGIFHYCQEVFEGLKAYTTKDNKIVCFRPDQNAERMSTSAKRLCMPSYPVDAFVQGVEQVVRANARWIPPYGSGATLYIRPFMVATSNVIGVKPADEYEFRILVTPVGPYYKGGLKPVAVRIPDYDRAAPHGTGNIKAGLNYAMSMYPSQLAHSEGFADNMYLDPETHKYVEESGGANFLFIDTDGTLVVPVSATDSILPSITRRSLVEIARTCLSMNVVQRRVSFEEVRNGAFTECGMCGTAAVISPVGEVVDGSDHIQFGAGLMQPGPKLSALRQMLVDIQQGDAQDVFGWLHEISFDD